MQGNLDTRNSPKPSWTMPSDAAGPTRSSLKGRSIAVKIEFNADLVADVNVQEARLAAVYRRWASLNGKGIGFYYARVTTPPTFHHVTRYSACSITCPCPDKLKFFFRQQINKDDQIKSNQ